MFVLLITSLIGGHWRIAELGSSNHQGRPLHRLHVYAAWEPETEWAAATCDFAVRLLATTKEPAADIDGVRQSLSAGPYLSRFFQESQDNLQQFTFKNMTLNEEQIRALATTESRPTMEVILDDCSLSDDNGCPAAFVECPRHDRGPTQLISCNINCHVLAAALEGNIRVTRLRLDRDTGDAGKGAIFRSLAENKGLVDLNLYRHSISDDNWMILCSL
jgi:hypothetical protein